MQYYFGPEIRTLFLGPQSVLPLYLSLSSLSSLSLCVQVNGFNMVNATHAEAVAALKSVTTSCQLVVSREVLVVMPEDVAVEGEGEQGEGQGEEPVQQDHAPEKQQDEGDESGEDIAKKMVADVLDRSLKR